MAWSTIPEICISPPTAQDPGSADPVSPLALDGPDDGFRPVHLTPPPTRISLSGRLSPLRPMESTAAGKGLEPERFEALLKASKKVGGKRAVDLRKEIALKAHKTKQFERRALFLSKIAESPSPAATFLPKTPPDSPAIFHYTLPSPGLVSPLAMFESISCDDPSVASPDPWIEEVAFRVEEGKLLTHVFKHPVTTAQSPGDKPVSNLPSLDEITARLGLQGQVTTTHVDSEQPRTIARRLPAFLLANSHHQNCQNTASSGEAPAAVPDLKGNLTAVNTPPTQIPESPRMVGLQRERPSMDSVHELVADTTISITSTEPSSPVKNFRARKSQDMLSAIRRRTLASSIEWEQGGDQERKARRRSDPVEIPGRARSGFEHPVLSMPGGF